MFGDARETPPAEPSIQPCGLGHLVPDRASSMSRLKLCSIVTRCSGSDRAAGRNGAGGPNLRIPREECGRRRIRIEHAEVLVEEHPLSFVLARLGRPNPSARPLLRHDRGNQPCRRRSLVCDQPEEVKELVDLPRSQVADGLGCAREPLGAASSALSVPVPKGEIGAWAGAVLVAFEHGLRQRDAVVQPLRGRMDTRNGYAVSVDKADRIALGRDSERDGRMLCLGRTAHVSGVSASDVQTGPLTDSPRCGSSADNAGCPTLSVQGYVRGRLDKLGHWFESSTAHLESPANAALCRSGGAHSGSKTAIAERNCSPDSLRLARLA